MASWNHGEEEVYNILPLHDMLLDHDALRFPEVRAAVTALKSVEKLCLPPNFHWVEDVDLLDWLAAFFGFQTDNVKNQRENVVLLLANYQMRLELPPVPIDKLDHSVVRHLRKKVLKNYKKWCSFMGRKTNLWILKRRHAKGDERRELLYACLYFLVWGEAANLRFMPECLCFIFHHMAGELNRILENDTDKPSEKPPFSIGENGFLKKVVTPLYNAVRAEADASRDGRAPHSAWRNYDDMNEYFWSKRCFSQLPWPLNPGSHYLVEPGLQARRWTKQKVGKTGFVEQRSFWNIFRSFDHLWSGNIVLLQAMIILAWNGTGLPWKELLVRDSEARVLSIFITWAGLRVLQALLDAGMQYNLISRETRLIGLRMILKIFVASCWTIIFVVMYTRMWAQRHKDGKWSASANTRLVQFLETAGVFIMPEVLALLLFILPWIRNFVEKSEWRIFHVMTWWFETRLFVARGLREGLVDNIKYTLFWVVLLISKILFSYFFQIRPMIEPTKDLLRHVTVKYAWHEFFKNNNNVIVFIMWAPVILVYLMDVQIWYFLFSSVVGAMVGLLSHIGEIRNIRQLKLRFPFFASAMQFHLMPEYTLCAAKAWGWLALVKDMWERFKLRYGLGRPFKKIESKSLEAGKFVHIWNEIISIFREEDIISDEEVELLEFPIPSWNISILQWPSFLLSNEIFLALGRAEDWQGSEEQLWKKISKHEYRRCAVIECYDSLKHLLNRIVTKGSNESCIIEMIVMEIQSSLDSGIFTQKYKLTELPEVHSRILALLGVLVEKPGAKDQRKVVRALQNLYDVVIHDLPTDQRFFESLHDALLATERRQLLFLEAIELPDPNDELFFRQVRRVYTMMNTREPMNDVPKNLEARRRIAFFSNSLFMNMPRAPSIEKMFSFSVLTPYYCEDVMYSKEQLRVENEDGVSIIFYLQKIFPDEWNNFLERMYRQYVVMHPDELWKLDKARELRLWASYRGQTLARTVRGMMYHNRALQMLAYVDSASEIEMQQGRELLNATSWHANGLVTDRLSSVRGENIFGSMSSGLSVLYRRSQLHANALMKFTYVAACQIYGTQKMKRDPRAEDISFLLKQHETLRIAYVDEVTERDSRKYFSVLVKYDSIREEEVEIYRVQLPGPLKLGEWKPENQNHALIFTRGDAVQITDINHNNYFEESLKVRNLLQEFMQHYGLRRPQVLGIREHILTGSVSSLARFTFSQELSFVSLGQRVLSNPLKIRMHYGDPDMFDRLWFLTRGGLGKASRGINISDDIFAGFNCTLRGGNVTHHEYLQVGKGRDVGLNQISYFEAKAASGNCEQLLSRDVYRLGHRLDFFRMLSFYYTTVGFYINNLIVVLVVYAFLWGRAYLALSGADKSIEKVDALSNKALLTSLNEQFLIQIGLFTVLPMIVENSLEHGFSSSVWDFLTLQLQLSSVFYAFSMGTKAHFFGRRLLHGGSEYRATSRGFVVRHQKFAEIYRQYARSHFIKGIELIFLLIVYQSYQAASTNTPVYVLLVFSGWFLAVSWIMAPFLFNPSGLDWLKTVEDFDDFLSWIWFKRGGLTRTSQSWEAWWNEEQDYLRTTGLWGQVLEVALSLRFFFFQYGMVYHLKITAHHKSILVYLVSWTYVMVAVVIYTILAQAAEKYSAKQHLYYRAIQALVIIFVLLIFVLLLELTSVAMVDLFVSLLAFIPTGWGIVSIALVLKPFLVPTCIWPMIVAVARLYELTIGAFVLAPVAVLSWMPGSQAMQTRILFNEAFSRGLQISRLLVGKRPNPR